MRRQNKPPFELPTLEEIDKMGEDEHNREEPDCVECDGVGAIDGITCLNCDGTGKEKPLDFRLI